MDYIKKKAIHKYIKIADIKIGSANKSQDSED